MDEKKIQQIEKELFDNINKEQSTDDEIINKSKEIAAHLTLEGTVKADIDNKVYMFKYRLLKSKTPKQAKDKIIMEDVDVIFMIIVNEALYKITGSKYKPFTASAVVEKALSLQENLEKVVETFIRHVTGNIKVEEIEE